MEFALNHEEHSVVLRILVVVSVQTKCPYFLPLPVAVVAQLEFGNTCK
jgi:hypothetical protein